MRKKRWINFDFGKNVRSLCESMLGYFGLNYEKEKEKYMFAGKKEVVGKGEGVWSKYKEKRKKEKKKREIDRLEKAVFIEEKLRFLIRFYIKKWKLEKLWKEKLEEIWNMLCDVNTYHRLVEYLTLLTNRIERVHKKKGLEDIVHDLPEALKEKLRKKRNKSQAWPGHGDLRSPDWYWVRDLYKRRRGWMGRDMRRMQQPYVISGCRENEY